MNLWPHQQDAVEELRSLIRDGKKNIILSMPTGSGKTIVATHLIAECLGKGKRAVFVADRVQLVDQTSAVLDAEGIEHGVLMAAHWRWRPWSKVQVASAQTIQKRSWPEADLIIVDEAHSQYKTITDRIAARDTVAIGLTATPLTRGLGKHYDAVVTVTTTRKLIEGGTLAPFVIYAAVEPDMEGAKVVAGEWTDEVAAERSMPLVGDCVAEYLKHGDGKKFIAFGVNVAHCEEMQRQFLAAGLPTGLYTYRTGDEDRARMLGEFRKPDSYLRGLISVAALAKGFDVPDIGVVIVARPLRKSLTEHIQMLGRGLRRDPEDPAKRCVILDHSGNSLRFWDEMNEFFDEGAKELDDGSRKKKAATKKREPKPMKCSRCHHIHAPRPSCPACGFEYPKRSAIEHMDGELIALGSGGAATRDDKQRIYSELLFIARRRNRKDGWAAHKYRALFGVWPRQLADVTSEPSRAVLRWVQSQDIAWAHRRQTA